MTTSPHLRVAPIPAPARPDAPAPVARPPVAKPPVARAPAAEPRLPEPPIAEQLFVEASIPIPEALPEPAVYAAPQRPSKPATIPPIETPFARSPKAPRKRAGISPIAKLGTAAAGLTVLILLFLVPNSGPQDISEVMPLAATVVPPVTGPMIVTPASKPKSVAPEVAPEVATLDVSSQRPQPRPTLTATRPVEPAPNAAAEWQQDFVAQLTAGTVAALRREALTGPTIDLTPALNMVRTAQAHGKSNAQIDRLLNESWQDNKITLPRDLIQSNGRVDTTKVIAIASGR